MTGGGVERSGTRAEQVAALFAQAQASGSVFLGTLTDDEDCVFGGGRWAFTDIDVWTNWQARPAVERQAATRTAFRSLAASGLVTDLKMQERRVHAELSAALGVIEIARSRADFLIAPSAQPGTPAVLPYGYAVVDQVGGLRGVVVEVRGPGWHDYRLVSPQRAAHGLAGWMTGTVDADDWGPRQDASIVEVMRLDEKEPQAAGVTVREYDGALRGASLHFGGRRTQFDAGDLEALTGELVSLIREAAEIGIELKGG